MSATMVMAQRDAALAKGNSVRSERAALRRELRGLGQSDGARVLAEVLESPPWFLARMLVYEMLGMWRVGEARRDMSVRNRRLMQRAEVGPWTTVERLTERQRLALVEGLRAHTGLGGPGPLRRRVPSVSVAVPRVLVCEGCGERLRVVSVSGLCGWCVEERERAR